MAVFRCKMCGGDLEVTEGKSTCICEFCGTEQTLPKVKDDNIGNLFNRANTLRIKAEFDKASAIYEKIIENNEKESEAYWGLILCRYGIEYVEDPKTFQRIPTCHRASYDAVVSDDDFKMAIRYADETQKELYEQQAKQIDVIQKRILSLAQKEEPYDVFICYKETGEDGKRTQDSVIANDIYYQLTQEGYKVFYAAITLEDKLGQDYEPCIFSALNTAKVMLSLGTKPEYFNAVWVKNEWSRFLKLMKKDRSKMLFPCYRDMDAYELPEEFSHLQAQDMSKIGFINDLVRGIKKVIAKKEEKTVIQQVVQQQDSNTNQGVFLQRGNMALEDKEWDKADQFFEEILNQDAQCVEAYLGKWLAKSQCSNFDELIDFYKRKYEEYTTVTLQACQEDKGRIAVSLSQNIIPGVLDENKIKELYQFDLTYISKLSCRCKQKEQELKEISEDKLLGRVKQYASEELKQKIDYMVEEVTKVLEERIEAAKKEDEKHIASIKKEYQAFLEQADEKAKQLKQKMTKQKKREKQDRIHRLLILLIGYLVYSGISLVECDFFRYFVGGDLYMTLVSGLCFIIFVLFSKRDFLILDSVIGFIVSVGIVFIYHMRGEGMFVRNGWIIAYAVGLLFILAITLVLDLRKVTDTDISSEQSEKEKKWKKRKIAILIVDVLVFLIIIIIKVIQG